MRRHLYLFPVLLLGLLVAAGGRAAAQAKIVNDPSIFEPVFVSDPQGAIQAARERIAAGDLAGAVKGLEVYVISHPGEAGPERFLGDLYYRQGRFDKAEEVYQRILAHNPGDRETHNRLGVVYATQNRVDDAIYQFDKALPGTDSVADLVAMHLRKGDLPQYRSQMQQIADSLPNNSDSQSEMGQILAALHKPAEALGYFMRALDSDPESLTALNGLGLAYFDLHNFTEAEKNFHECLRIDITNYTCTNNLGAAYLQAGDDDVAKPYLIRAHSLAPERPEALVNFGFLADRRGDWKSAVNFYVQATVVGPYLPEAYIDLGIDYEHENLFQLAQAALLKGIAAAPEDGRIRFLLAKAYASQGQKTLALDQLKIAEQSLDPDVARLASEESSRLSSEKSSPQI
ncbi:MAG: tetratricopeptide repeat protein [Candidatus Eremiobacteraeota bacterium]|nr:tetratricopeptide repeat protein [Candidatus Eremiobacteraeota bacterium]